MVAGTIGAIGAAAFALPDELQLAHLYELRKLQATLRHYQTFVPDRCEEAVSAYKNLRLQVARATIELAVVSADLGRCLERAPEEQCLDRRLLAARAMYADSVAAFEAYRPSVATRIAAAIGARRPYTSREHAEANLRLAEVERRLAFIEKPAAMLASAQKRLRDAIALSAASDTALAGVAANNLGNVLNHLYLLRRPDVMGMKLGFVDSRIHRALLEQALRSYANAVDLLEGAPALQRLVRVNLAIEHLVVAAADSALLEASALDWTDRRSRVMASLETTRRLLLAAQGSAGRETHTSLLMPNFALALGTASVVGASGDSVAAQPVSWLLGSKPTDGTQLPSSPKGLAALHQAERILSTARDEVVFSRVFSLRQSLFQFEQAIRHFEGARKTLTFGPEGQAEEVEAVPFEYRATLVARGIAQVELAMTTSDLETLSKGIESLQKGLLLPRLDGNKLTLDPKIGLLFPQTAVEPTRAASSTALEALALVNLWRASLFRFSYDEGESELEIGEFIANHVSNDWTLWERELDPVLTRSIIAIQSGVSWRYGERSSDPAYLGRAFSALDDSRMAESVLPAIAWRF